MRAGLLRGTLEAARGEPVKAWAFPPTGRWRYPGPGGAARPLAPQATRASRRPAVRMHQTPPERGHRTTYLDWGEEVEGYLMVHYRGRTPLATVHLGRSLPPEEQPPANLLIGPKGRNTWQDSQPRRFRYVVLRGLARVERAEVIPAAAGVPLGPAVAPRPRGLLGIAPPSAGQSGSPVEDERWRRF
jgi:hypothetical protein